MTLSSHKSALIALLAGLTILSPAGSRADSNLSQPVKVVELFTSQGCNSCPPADALLGDIARRPGVLALSFHVDYWDYIGWKDTFALHQSSERQRTYARLMHWQYVYTPQLVINGQTEVVGSHAGKIDRKIDETPPADMLPIQVTAGPDGNVRVTLPPAKMKRPSWVWLVRYTTAEKVDIRRGENGGKMLTYHNVVRAIDRIAVWRGVKARQIDIPLADKNVPEHDQSAVIVQAEGFGKILAAARLPAPGS